MTGTVTILTGPAGAGKSTVSARVAASLTRSVHLHTDDFWDFIAAGAIPPYLPESDTQNHIVLRAVSAAAFAYADGGYDTVDYTREPVPPLSPTDARWVDEWLRQQGRR